MAPTWPSLSACPIGTFLAFHSENPKPLKILMSSLDAYGHFNASLGLGERLVQRGHYVYYANRRGYQKFCLERGIKFIPVENFDPTMAKQENNEVTLKFIERYADSMEKSSLERLTEWTFKDLFATMEYFNEMKRLERVLEVIINQLKPDLIIGDFTFIMPLFMKSSIPYVPLLSTNPLPLYDGLGPPVGSGYSVHGPRDLWEKYRKAEQTAMWGLRQFLRPWFWRKFISPPEARKLRTYAKYFGIYIYPRALDYNEFTDRPSGNWIRMDMSIRQYQGPEFVIPECLASRPGKLIYLSMGSLGSVNLKLMRHLVSTLSKCLHRFIVSKGPHGDKLELGSNMWGENFVNQLAVLPKVDLVITNGGNNTVIETLAAGKPMIVMPLFYDQLDNAQRIEDKGLGRRIDPFTFDENHLFQTIESLLSDDQLAARIRIISQDLKDSTRRCNVIQLLEQLVHFVKYNYLEKELGAILYPSVMNSCGG